MYASLASAAGLHEECVHGGSTAPDWARRAIAALPALLVEQAHLEKKAAAAAVRLLFQVPAVAWMQKALSVLAREELVHFERTLRLLQQRGIAFCSQPPSGYAEALKAAARRTMPERLLDELLIGALIEARSHERMSLLGEALAATDAEAAAFYGELVEAEARHRCIYLDIAAELAGIPAVRSRWRELAAREFELVRGPFSARLHGGSGDGS